MKTLTTMTAVAALVAGMSIAGAQTNSNQGATTNPGSINAAPTQQGNTGKSGSQPKATKDMSGSSNSVPSAKSATTNPASPNAAPTQEGNSGQSGMQPKSTADMPARGSSRTTTGAASKDSQKTINPSASDAKPTDKAGGSGK